MIKAFTASALYAFVSLIKYLRMAQIREGIKIQGK